jgi:ribonuclease HI
MLLKGESGDRHAAKTRLPGLRCALVSLEKEIALQHYIQRIYTDGACSGNPGPGGWGVVAYVDNGNVHELGGREPKTTNNRMELQGAIAALQLLWDIQQTTPVTLYTDSQYVKNGITKWITGWKKKNWKTSTGKEVVNIDLWKQLDTLHQHVKTQLPLTWEYVRGHTGDIGNERCDAIARAFSKNSPPALHQVAEFISLTSLAPQSATANGESGSLNLSSSPSAPIVASPNQPTSQPMKSASVMATHQSSQAASTEADTPIDTTDQPSLLGKRQQLRALVETFQLADTIAEQHYLLTTSELADLVGNTVSTVTNRGDSWIWRNWLIKRVRQEGNQILWQLERIS